MSCRPQEIDVRRNAFICRVDTCGTNRTVPDLEVMAIAILTFTPQKKTLKKRDTLRANKNMCLAWFPEYAPIRFTLSVHVSC